jgi:hypothetical protein
MRAGCATRRRTHASASVSALAAQTVVALLGARDTSVCCAALEGIVTDVRHWARELADAGRSEGASPPAGGGTAAARRPGQQSGESDGVGGGRAGSVDTDRGPPGIDRPGGVRRYGADGAPLAGAPSPDGDSTAVQQGSSDVGNVEKQRTVDGEQGGMGTQATGRAGPATGGADGAVGALQDGQTGPATGGADCAVGALLDGAQASLARGNGVADPMEEGDAAQAAAGGQTDSDETGQAASDALSRTDTTGGVGCDNQIDSDGAVGTEQGGRSQGEQAALEGAVDRQGTGRSEAVDAERRREAVEAAAAVLRLDIAVLGERAAIDVGAANAAWAALLQLCGSAGARLQLEPVPRTACLGLGAFLARF